MMFYVTGLEKISFIYTKYHIVGFYYTTKLTISRPQLCADVKIKSM